MRTGVYSGLTKAMKVVPSQRRLHYDIDVFAFVSLEERSNPFGELAIIMSRVLPQVTEA